MVHMRRLHTSSMCIVSSMAQMTGGLIRSWSRGHEKNIPTECGYQFGLIFRLRFFSFLWMFFRLIFAIGMGKESLFNTSECHDAPLLLRSTHWIGFSWSCLSASSSLAACVSATRLLTGAAENKICACAVYS